MSTLSHAQQQGKPFYKTIIGPGCWDIPEKMADWFLALVPHHSPSCKGGRPRENDRKLLAGIFYLLRTGCQWKAIPRCYGAPSTIHDRFQEWVQDGVFARAHRAGLLVYDNRKGIQWVWQSCDGAMTKAPLGGLATGPNPTDRGKKGTKRSILTDGYGIPLSVAVDGANINDHLMLENTLESLLLHPDPGTEQNMCLDKGYDYPVVQEILAKHKYVPHIRSRGEEQRDLKSLPGYKARRWVVERVISWENRFRRILIRWEKKPDNYLSMVQLACCYILFHAAKVFG